MKPIPYGRQFIDSADITLVSKVLKEDLITTGKYVDLFEKKLKFFLKSKYALSCSSGTSAIHLALLAANIRQNDIIVMPSINFIAAYNICKTLGAKIYLSDVDPLTGQMTPEKLLECIKKNNIRKIKVILTMYMGGYPNDVVKFYKIKKLFKCILIEDACHAFGAKYKFKDNFFNVGSCKHSDISTFSFHPVKTIASGEGGAISTNNKIFFKKIKLLRSHGIIRTKKHWDYDVSLSGFNYRMSDINCALAYSQLKKIKNFLRVREKIFFLYKKKLSNLKNFLKFPEYDIGIKSSYHLFLISFDFKKLKTKRNFLFSEMIKKNIFFQYHYKPIFFFTKIFKTKNKNMKKLYKGALEYYNSVVSIPIYVGLTYQKQVYIINGIKKFILSHLNEKKFFKK